jgi:hypothetical protein
MTAFVFIALIGAANVLQRRAMLHAPSVDVSEVHRRCGQAVKVAGWVSATGARYFIISREAPDPIVALHDPGQAVSPRIFVVADSIEGRKQSFPEIGTKVTVRGVVVCDPEGTIQLEEHELVASERP